MDVNVDLSVANIGLARYRIKAYRGGKAFRNYVFRCADFDDVVDRLHIAFVAGADEVLISLEV